MKTIYSTVIVSLLLFGSVLLPAQADAVVCQNKTAIIYSNGMFNIKREARKSLKVLKAKLRQTSPAFVDSTKYEYHLAFASDGSQYTPPSINVHPILALLDEAYVVANGAGQVTEVVLQRILQEDVSAFWRWLSGKQDGGSALQNIMNTMASGINSSSYIYDTDLQNHVRLYKDLLNAGKRVIIVSHSQGNFYANASYSQLILSNSAWVNSVGNVQVSSPASSNLGAKLGGDEPQITVNEDMIMNFVQSISLGETMPRKPKPDSGWSPNMEELGGPAARNAATYGHNFVKWYLAGSYTRKFILNGILNSIVWVKYPSQCQTAPPIITTVAGNGDNISYGDGGAALTAGTPLPRALKAGPDGSLYVASDGRIRKIDPNGTITTVAGTGQRGFSPDGTLAISAAIAEVGGLDIDPDGNLYFSDTSNHMVRKIDKNGTIQTVAGTGVRGLSGDGGMAKQAQLKSPRGIAFANDGSLIIADYYNDRIRKISPNGIISTIAGIGPKVNQWGMHEGFYSGDGGLAKDADIFWPSDVEVSVDGTIYFTDQGNKRVRKIDPDGIISTYAGNGFSSWLLHPIDGALAVDITLNTLRDLALDDFGNLFFADNTCRIIKTDVNGIVSTYAGVTGAFVGDRCAYTGDGGLATEAEVRYLRGLDVGINGDLYLSDYFINRVRKVGP